jgi:hypothetical protein
MWLGWVVRSPSILQYNVRSQLPKKRWTADSQPGLEDLDSTESDIWAFRPKLETAVVRLG